MIKEWSTYLNQESTKFHTKLYNYLQFFIQRLGFVDKMFFYLCMNLDVYKFVLSTVLFISKYKLISQPNKSVENLAHD